MAHAHAPDAKIHNLSDSELRDHDPALSWDGHTLLTRCYSQQGSNAAIAFISENRSSLYMAGKRGAILDAAVTAYDAPFVDYLIKGEKLLAAYGDGRKANLVCYAIGTLVRNIYQRDIAGHENLEQKELVLKQLKENGLFPIAVVEADKLIAKSPEEKQLNAMTNLTVYGPTIYLLEAIAKHGYSCEALTGSIETEAKDKIPLVLARNHTKIAITILFDLILAGADPQRFHHYLTQFFASKSGNGYSIGVSLMNTAISNINALRKEGREISTGREGLKVAFDSFLRFFPAPLRSIMQDYVGPESEAVELPEIKPIVPVQRNSCCIC